MKGKRNARGAVLGLAIALTLVLAILATAFFKLTLFFGGAEETRNATDAGALNAGKHSFDLSVTAPDDHQFDDVADANNEFNLTNINRVWAKAMLANANVAAMEMSNQSTGQATLHAKQLYDGANSISGRLADQLKNAKNFYNNFESITSGNNVRLLGSNAHVSALKDKGWQTSCVDRGEASNILFNEEQLPIKAEQLIPGLKRPLVNPVNVNDSIPIPGYAQIPILDKKFYLVSFKEHERTHLINAENFAKNTEQAKPFDGWDKPIPNAFSVHGSTVGKNAFSSEAVSWVQVNPQYKFDLGMPHSFIRIKLYGNAVTYMYGDQTLDTGSYGYAPEGQNVGPYITASQSKVTFTAQLGKEYQHQPLSLYDVITALKDHPAVMEILLQRCREIKKECSPKELQDLLGQVQIDPNKTEYLIYPISKNVLYASAADQAPSMAKWINSFVEEAADGSKKTIDSDDTDMGPNEGWFADVSMTDDATGGQAQVHEHTDFSWTPGSGYNDCLGELSIARNTQVKALIP